MKYFHNPETNNVHAYDDDAPTHFILSHLVPMSEEEVRVHIESATATPPVQAEDERNWRDSALALVTWLRDRHRDQTELEVVTTLADAQFKELLVYIQALRNWPQSPDFPDPQYRPLAPPWVVEQTE